MEVLVDELVQGKELAEQLREQLKLITKPEERQFLVEKILSSYQKALSLLNWEDKNSIHSSLDSPVVSNGTDFAEQECVDNRPTNVYKKRKTEPRWTEQVKVCLGNGLEDGFSWRKYGQKDILGATFPRGYYRCTHRHSQGCLATKQVQRSDKDPTTFEVTYRGSHSCFQSSPVVNDKSKSNKITFDQFEQHEEKPKPKPKPEPEPLKLKQLPFNFKDGIKIQDLEPVDDIFPSFSLPHMETNLLGSFSPEFLTPATSAFTVSPSQIYSFGLDYKGTVSKTDSKPALFNNSPMGEWDMLIDFTDFEASFPLEKPELHALGGK